MHENEISKIVLNSAIEVHRTLGGPGLLESIYEEALAWVLSQAGLSIRRQLEVPVVYKNQQLDGMLRLDLLVEGIVIVECKATTRYSDIFEAQTPTYLRLMNLKLGLVINFGERFVKDGFRRVVNGL
jgi:GxxExxY protein